MWVIYFLMLLQLKALFNISELMKTPKYSKSQTPVAWKLWDHKQCHIALNYSMKWTAWDSKTFIIKVNNFMEHHKYREILSQIRLYSLFLIMDKLLKLFSNHNLAWKRKFKKFSWFCFFKCCTSIIF